MFGARPEKQAGFSIKKEFFLLVGPVGFQGVGPGSVSPGKVSGPMPDLLSGSTGGGALLSVLTNPPQQVALMENHCFRLPRFWTCFCELPSEREEKGEGRDRIIKVVKET